MAAVHQLLQRGFDGLQLGELGVHLGEMLQRQPAHFAAGPLAVLPQAEQGADLRQREAQVTRVAAEAQRVNLAFAVDP